MAERRFCCARFQQCFEDGEVCHADEYDATEWYVPEWHHLFFCPFCGSFIMGEGWGTIPRPFKDKRKLIFIENINNSKALGKLFELAINLGGKSLALWPFDKEAGQNVTEKNTKELFGLDSELKHYKHGVRYVETYHYIDLTIDRIQLSKCYLLSKKITKYLTKKVDVVKNIIASMTFYKEREVEWFFCVMLPQDYAAVKVSENDLNIVDGLNVEYSKEWPK